MAFLDQHVAPSFGDPALGCPLTSIRFIRSTLRRAEFAPGEDEINAILAVNMHVAQAILEIIETMLAARPSDCDQIRLGVPPGCTRRPFSVNVLDPVPRDIKASGSLVIWERVEQDRLEHVLLTHG